MKKVVFNIGKIKSTEEVLNIEKILEKDKYISSAIINQKESTIEIDYKDLTINEVEDKLIQTGITSLGVELTNYKKKKSKLVLILLGIFISIILLISILSFFKINIISSNTKSIILYIITIIFILYGINIPIDGIKCNLKGRSNVNSLLTIGIILSFLYSTYNLYMCLTAKATCNNYSYLEIIIFLIYFKKLGDYLEDSNREKIEKEILGLEKTNIKKVNILENDRRKETLFENVKVGDRIICSPGDKVFFDGTIVKGSSHTAEALINGKSLPMIKDKNDIILSGSLNCEDELEYTVDRVYKDSIISSIRKLVHEEISNKPKYFTNVDRFCSYIVPISIIIGIVISILNFMITKDIKSSIMKFTTIMLISSPFGLALSSPLSFRRIIKQSKKGLLIKRIQSLEGLKKIDTIVFDKTGTITNGYLSISRINNHSEMTDKELLALLGSVEKHSTHALARGISKYLREEKIKTSFDFITEDLIGYGVKAKDDKDLYYACNKELLEKLDIINSYKEEERKMRLDGNDVIYLVKNNKVIATFGLKDTIKKDADKVITSLKDKGYNIIMLSGDTKEISEMIAKKVGIDKVISNQTPNEKSAYIKKLLKEKHKVMMVGDGINDATAIAASTIGVSLKTNTDISNAASDIIITNDSLVKVLDLFHIGKSTRKLVKENIFLSIIPSIGLLIVTLGIIPKIKINALIIIIGLFISFILVLLNTLRVKNK